MMVDLLMRWLNMGKLTFAICVFVLLTVSKLSGQVNNYPYIMDSSAVAIDSQTISSLCAHKWSLVKLEETLRAEKRGMTLSSVMQYSNDSSFVESGARGKFAIENTFYINHYELKDQPKDKNKSFIKGRYFISRISDSELVLVKYSTSSKDWKKEYFFK